MAADMRQHGVPVLILDGGLGTTLEDIYHHDISTPLWSARPIEYEPEVIVEAHLAFLRAGARIISTATYQSAYDTFERSGYTRADTVRLMRKAVALACAAKDRFLAERPDLRQDDMQIALSLGPYGATLNSNEFDGIYPPPYGPESFAPGRRNSFLPGEEQFYEGSVEALKNFHLDRLRVFAEDDETWNSIDWIAFETVPLVREVTAIRRAVHTLYEELSAHCPEGRWRKRWWISTVHPFGSFPERTHEGESVAVRQVVAAILGQDGPGKALPAPDGIGINCTGVRYLSSIVAEMREAVMNMRTEQSPWLLLYPNGREWNVATQGWEDTGVDDDESAKTWGAAFAGSVRPSIEHRCMWRGAIVGGCCKSGPREISALAKVMKSI